MSKPVSDLLYESNARSEMVKGVNCLANAVKITLGPKGKNVAIYRDNSVPHLTKDGVTVANSINLREPFQNLGVQLVKEAAQRSAEIAGDGTTTSTVIAQKILNEGVRYLASGLDAREFISGLNTAAENVLEELENTRVEINSQEDLLNVATVSANGDADIGKLIADAIETVGQDGAISIEQARGFETTLEIVDGTVIDRGFLSPYFVTDQAKGVVELERVAVIIYNQTLNTAQSILPALEHAAKSNKSILIIANDVTNEALQTLVLNKMKGALNVCAIKAPEFGSARTVALQDIAAIVGGEVIATDDIDTIKETCVKSMGFCQKIIVDKNGTVLINTSGEEDLIEERTNAVRDDLNSATLSDIERSVCNRRLTRLSKGICVIRVGGATEAEMLEKKDRIDDALHAARAAKKSGTQPGGGTALFHSSLGLKPPSGKSESFYSGYNVLLSACKEPLKTISKNAGFIPELVIEKLRRKHRDKIGFNALNSNFGDMREFKIIDPHLVVVSSLRHAVSVSANILLVGCSVIITEENSENLGLIEKI